MIAWTQARTQGVQGGSDEPPFLAGYMYYLCDRLTLDDGLSSKDDSYCSRIIIRTWQGMGVARPRGSHFTRERGWVWT